VAKGCGAGGVRYLYNVCGGLFLCRKTHHKIKHLPRNTGGMREATMLEFLPKEVRDGLDAARKRDFARKSRLRVQVGEAVFPITRFWHDGFALDADLAPQLRGLVDVYDGSRHIFQCLIVASALENGDLICEFKRSTMVSDRPPLDYWRDENAPVGYLPKA
jgi:hypothetical protein